MKLNLKKMASEITSALTEATLVKSSEKKLMKKIDETAKRLAKKINKRIDSAAGKAKKDLLKKEQKKANKADKKLEPEIAYEATT